MLFALLAMVSCEKKLNVKDAPDFTVTTQSTTYKAGDTINFNIEGSADMISFYSGEVFHDYAFKEGRIVDVNGQGATLSFKSGVTLGSQPNQLSVLVSTNFDGKYDDFASVTAATWTDITSRFVLGTSATLLASTTQDISDLVVTGKPLYIAFKYVTKPQVANGFARQWMIESLLLNSNAQLNGAPVMITDQIHAGFRIVDQNPVNAPARSQVTTTRVTLYGNVYKDPNDPIYDPNNPIYDPNNPIYNPDSLQYNPNAVLPVFVPYDPNSPYNDPLSENWAVSAPIYLDTVDLGPDHAVAIRAITSPKLSAYSYKYSKPGTYKVFFVASNNTIDENKQVIKEIDFTITP